MAAQPPPISPNPLTPSGAIGEIAWGMFIYLLENLPSNNLYIFIYTGIVRNSLLQPIQNPYCAEHDNASGLLRIHPTGQIYPGAPDKFEKLETRVICIFDRTCR